MNDISFEQGTALASATRAHGLDRLRIALTIPPEHTQRLTDACSNLFHRRLRGVIAAVLERVQQDCRDLLVSEPLTLDLGDLPLADFDDQFCMRLERQLLQQLREQAQGRAPSAAAWEASSTGTRGVPADGHADILGPLAHYLRYGHWEGGMPSPAALDARLLEQLAVEPEHSLFVLAGHCLHRDGLPRLYRLLSSASLVRLCRSLAPTQSLGGPATPTQLLLCALHYFRHHVQPAMPALPPYEFVFQSEGNEQLLSALFESHFTVPFLAVVPVVPGQRRAPFDSRVASPLAPAALVVWLRALWRQPPVRGILQHRLSPITFGQLRAQLDGAAAEDGDANNVRGRRRVARERHGNGADLPAELVGVGNGGLCLLWGLLPDLFRQLGLLEQTGQRFLHPQAQIDAACRLEDLVWAEGDYAEWRMPLNKVLCGCSPDARLEPTQSDAQALEIIQRWLATLPTRLPAWKRFGVADIRHLFLQRPAWLSTEGGSLLLYVQPEAWDVLLADWPWPTEMLMLPWLTQPLAIRWQQPSTAQ